MKIVLGFFLAALLLLASGPGFRTRRQFDEHYQKHGREFGNISQQEYLRLGQELRDAPAGGPILEAVKPGGIITRLDRRKGCFGEYKTGGTIREIFIHYVDRRSFKCQTRRPNELRT